MAFGTTDYSFHLDNIFFKNIDGEEFQKGSVDVELTVTKNSETTHEFNFNINGVIHVPCDRCLDDMEIPISTKTRLFVKLGKEFSEESDEIVIIPEDEGEINIAWFLYEFISLEIPMKHVHAPGKCNKAMSSKLKKHITRSSDDMDDATALIEDDLLDDVNLGVDEEESEKTDPRWDELKKLIDNN